MAADTKSKFFTEVEFPFEPDPTNPRAESVVVWDPTKLKLALAQIELEVTKIIGGTSDYVPRAINPGAFGFPAMNAIKIFVNAPQDKTFPDIEQIANQDWGMRAGKHFASLLREARELKNVGEMTDAENG